jgi:hypothetical protein
VGGDDSRRPRVGVACPGSPRDPSTWSGTPAGLCAGLEAADVEVVPLDVTPGPAIDFVTKNLVVSWRLLHTRSGSLGERVRLARAMARIGPELATLRTAVIKRRLKGAGRLDGLVQIGAGYLPATDAPVAVFEDLTVFQAVELGYPEWRALPSSAVQARIDLQRRVYERSRVCCLTSHWAAESVIRDYGVPRERVFAVGVGRNHDPPHAARDWSTPRFLFIGTHWYGKIGDAVLRAFARLRGETPRARLDLVGDHPSVTLDGVYGHGRLHLTDRDDRNRMERLFQKATCFVLPSRYEAAAIAYVEAGSAGLPCIGTSVGGAKELIGEGGLIVDPRDEEALFAAMLQLSDPEEAERLGRLALSRSSLFTWRAVAERVLRALALPGVSVESFAEFL